MSIELDTFVIVSVRGELRHPTGGGGGGIRAGSGGGDSQDHRWEEGGDTRQGGGACGVPQAGAGWYGAVARTNDIGFFFGWGILNFVFCVKSSS